MTIEDFDKMAEHQLERCKEILGLKRSEYAKGKDKLYNFKRAAEIQRCTPERALWGMYVKHLTSVQDIVESIEQGEVPNTVVLIEKITDSINYHLLLEGLILERLKKKLLPNGKTK